MPSIPVSNGYRPDEPELTPAVSDKISKSTSKILLHDPNFQSLTPSANTHVNWIGVDDFLEYSSIYYIADLNPDGITDNSSAFLSQLNEAISQGKRFYVPEGNYYMDNGVVITSDNAWIEAHNNAIFTFANDSLGSDIMSSYCFGFSFNGSFDSEILLTVDAF